ncbi:MAG: phosphoenolpyruvate synthase [candidate division Zixibacteria bacterium]|nr:phosphoenolpyruvate synthase [candidate division Zixibacteria bacterium]
MSSNGVYIKRFDKLSSEDVGEVGGKNASLGEMLGKLKDRGVRVPQGFATTADAYREYIEFNDIRDKLTEHLDEIAGDSSKLAKKGKAIRGFFRRGEFPDKYAAALREAYRELSDLYNEDEVDVAVRSSATAEDLPSASFAGQQETFLNVSGLDDLLEACKQCYASLFTDRAISYRQEKGFDHMKVALSIGVQKMVRSDKSGAGVMFTIDTETGFKDVVVINAAWGLGENVVQGTVNPDEYIVFKPLMEKNNIVPIIGKKIGDKARKMIYARGGSQTTRNVDTRKKERNRIVLNDDEILQLSKWAVVIEEHYKKPMDIEWAKDGIDNNLYIVQARPETVHSQKEPATMKTYRLTEEGEEILTGLSIGEAISSGKASVLDDPSDIDEFEDGSILVTDRTDPDWVPIMKRAAGIITDYGGRTSHAAIVSRELGVPAIVGSGDATDQIEDGQEITLSCAEGDEGVVYQGILKYETKDIDLKNIPETQCKIKVNVASPAASFRWWRLPTDGIGLARMEFIINNVIKIHPMALVRCDDLEDNEARKQIRRMTSMYEDKTEYFVDHLSRGIAKIAAPHYPNPVLVRMSDFKTNEYAELIGGKEFESEESNPMLGFRGAARYYSEEYREAFNLECKAIKKVREKLGFDNIDIMIPFCRTLDEADKVLDALADNGVGRGHGGLSVFVMAEIPSNIILAEEFAARFDGFSIGSNDLTQLVLGIDRDSTKLADLFDERDEAVKTVIGDLIKTARANNTDVGICGQAPSDYPEFAEFLVRSGIDSISLNPDSVIDAKFMIAELESKIESK